VIAKYDHQVELEEAARTRGDTAQAIAYFEDGAAMMAANCDCFDHRVYETWCFACGIRKESTYCRMGTALVPP